VFTLVPSRFFDPATARQALAEVAGLKEEDAVEHLDLPQYDAVLVYTTGEDSVIVDGTPEIYKLLSLLPDCPEYNKILCSLCDGRLHLAVAQGENLLLSNSFAVQDFTTAEYYIFLSLKSLQLNPEISTICWRTPLDAEDEMSLYRYFKAVVNL
jgi:hypothetical protein